MRFPVLTNTVRYSVQFQAKMVLALSVVHNFIRLHGGVDDEIEQSANSVFEHVEAARKESDPVMSVEMSEGIRLRDDIALKMWNNYETILQKRRAQRSQRI